MPTRAWLPDEPVRGNGLDRHLQTAGRWRLALQSGPDVDIPEGEEADYRACMLGLRDYVNKNGFSNVVLGLSGGIDSALCAALAVDALGEERLRAVMLPYPTPPKARSPTPRPAPEAAWLPLRHGGD
jgi:asparagine synthetase B (glutamine-hydrolysing)